MERLRDFVKHLRAPLKVRYETFGGIIALDRPSSLIFVDKDYLRSLGYGASPLWDTSSPFLTAPTEVHLALTNTCNRGCVSCYMDSGEALPGELGADGMGRVVDELADMGVFHLALGGGESFGVPWLFDVAAHARRAGLVPNVTTNGSLIDEHTARRCRVFGRINVSVDGLGRSFEESKGRDGFAEADRAIGLLKAHHPRVGINVTLGRSNFDHLEAIVRYAKAKGLSEIEILRFKPAGRARAIYFDRQLRPDQHEALYPLVKKLTRRHRIHIKLDCSFVPMICFHRPRIDVMERFGVFGCEAGNILIGVRADGAVSACSFEPSIECAAAALKAHWRRETAFSVYRRWADQAPEPCRSCEYLTICKGGCHVVAAFVTGDPRSPDPECPFVHDQRGSHLK